MRQNGYISLDSVIAKSLLGIGMIIFFLKNNYEVKSFGHIIALVLVFVVVYDICTVFQYCLRLSGNYFVAIIAFFVFAGIVASIYSSIEEKVKSANSQILVIICEIGLIALTALPFVSDVKNLILAYKINRCNGQNTDSVE